MIITYKLYLHHFNMIGGIARRSLSYALPGAVKGRAYVPQQVVEFDSKGDTLIYSCQWMKGASIWFPVPYSIGTWSIPAMAWAWNADLLGLGIGSAIWAPIMWAAVLPHCWHLYNLRFRVNKIWYVRGGHWKFETSGINHITSYHYTEPANITPNAGEMTEAGELMSDAKLEAEVW